MIIIDLRKESNVVNKRRKKLPSRKDITEDLSDTNFHSIRNIRFDSIRNILIDEENEDNSTMTCNDIGEGEQIFSNDNTSTFQNIRNIIFDDEDITENHENKDNE